MKDKTGPLNFDKGIWGETVYRYGESKRLIVLIVAMFVGLDIYAAIAGRSVSNSASTVVWSTLAILVHNAILNGKSNVLFDGKSFLPFLWRSLVLSIPGILAVFAALVTFSGMQSPGNLRVLALVPIYGAVSAMTLGFLGTWLPSVFAKDGDRSLAAAANRGRSVFGYTTSRLLAGCLPTGLILVAVIFAVSMLGSLYGLDVTLSNGLEPFTLLVSALSAAISAFMFVMIPVILSRAYLIAEARNAKVENQGAARAPDLEFKPLAPLRDDTGPA